METIFQTNLRCGGCLSKLSPLLDEEPLVKKWSADLSDPRKLLTVKLETAESKQRVHELVQQAGFVATEISSSHNQEATKAPFTLSTYQPLFLVVAYVAGATLFVESLSGEWDWNRAMSHFMGFFFLGFSFFKLLNVSAFASAFSTYDIVAKRSLAYAVAYPFIEFALGILFLSGAFSFLANIGTALVMGIGLIGVIAAVRKRQAIQCACLGTAFNLPMSFVTIVENSTMLAMAIYMLAIHSMALTKF